MLRAQGRGGLREQLCAIREPANRKPACNIVCHALGSWDGTHFARIDHLQMDATLIGVSEILSVW